MTVARYAAVISGGRVLLSCPVAGKSRLPHAGEVPELVAGADFSFETPVAFDAVSCDAGAEAPQGFIFVPLRDSAMMIPGSQYAAAAKASELIYWKASNRHCSVCGAVMERASEISLRCSACGREVWPQLSPAVLVLVRRGDEALLVHARNFTRPFFGLVAGFVETGESLEQCVAREVMEETSLEIDNIRYFGSQSWPFPSQLMIGFTADYAGGELRFADGELSEGGFFSRASLPQIPSPPSLARTMIEAWIGGVV